MKIFLLQDLPRIGMAGEIVNVSDGFASNYVLPRKLGVQVTAQNEGEFAKRLKKIEHRTEVIQSKTSMLAEKIKSMQITVKRKIHDDGKLYGSISEQEVADALSAAGVSVAKSQVLFEKSIKSTGSFPVIIRLSSSLKPTCTVKVVAIEQ